MKAIKSVIAKPVVRRTAIFVGALAASAHVAMHMLTTLGAS